jgi:hypothetical protein
MVKKRWSPTEDEVFRRLYPQSKTEHLALYFGCSVCCLYNRAALLGIRKSAEWKGSDEGCFLRRHPEAGAPMRFKPGHVPPNKGLRRPGWAPGRMAETQFKKGQMPWTWVPLWSERMSKEGYLEIKFRERKGRHGNWASAHVLLWEDRHGPVPKGHKLAFKDGDRAHIALNNLELVSNAEMMRRNSVHNLPKELQLVIQLNGALKRKLRELSEDSVKKR